MWSNLRLFRRQDGFAFIERRSLRDAQLTELKKYAVFSKVTIAADDEHVLLGVAGFQARAALKNLFSELPDAENSWSAKAPPQSCGLNTGGAFPAGDRCGNRRTRDRRAARRSAAQQPAVAGAEHRSGSAGH
jgi:folate-binding Fe-S cluster repair protein YgfZ